MTGDKGVEREVTDNLIAEVTRESPFLVDDDNLVDQVFSLSTSKIGRMFLMMF